MKCTPWIMGAAIALTLIACDKKEEAKVPAPAAAEKGPAKPADVEIDSAELALFKPLPQYMTSDGKAPDENLVTLGRMLYYENRLSKNQEISCNSCHMLDKFGVDNEPTSPGHKAQRGSRNSPTSFNAAGHIAQFWDGRAEHVEEQAQGPMTNPVEMAMVSADQVKVVLSSMPEYVQLFATAFPDDKDPVNIENAAKAIGAFERGLTTPGKWDKFLKGDKAALSQEEKRGFKTFMNVGCQACHNGVYLGGSLYQKLGVVHPWPELTDEGRFEATNKESDKFFFKVPSLRNIQHTGPYLHDGSVKELDVMVSKMAYHQLGKELTPQQTKSITTFLKALDGEVNKAYVAKPELPPSTNKTPKPIKD